MKSRHEPLKKKKKKKEKEIETRIQRYFSRQFSIVLRVFSGVRDQEEEFAANHDRWSSMRTGKKKG